MVFQLPGDRGDSDEYFSSNTVFLLYFLNISTGFGK